MAQYRLTDMTSGVTRDIEAASLADAVGEATSWMEDCDWNMVPTDETIWVGCRIAEMVDGEPIDEDAENFYDRTAVIEVEINPPEPKCEADDHDWQSPYEIVGGIKSNPGVWGHGGGVVIHECCMVCGCEKITDTWAQNRENGKQGLRSVRYEPGKYAEQVAAAKEEEE